MQPSEIEQPQITLPEGMSQFSQIGMNDNNDLDAMSDGPISDGSDDIDLHKQLHKDEKGSAHNQDEGDGLVSDSQISSDGSEVTIGSDVEIIEKTDTKGRRLRQLRVRPQQQQLFQNSLGNNSIIYLPTGTGKTLVSILAMHYYFNKYGWEKKVIFLANTVQLVKQQAEAIKRYLPAISRNQAIIRFIKDKCNNNHYEINFTEENVREYVVCLHGEKNEQVGMTQRRLIETNIRDRKQLMNKIKGARIVVMIAQMFVNCLRRGYTKLSDYVFLVYDECHHCKGDHPYNNVMKEFYFEEKNKQIKAIEADKDIPFEDKLPYIMGLTASPVVEVYFEKDKLVKEIKALCVNLDSDYVYYQTRPNDSRPQCQEIYIDKITTEDTRDQFIPTFTDYLVTLPKHHLLQQTHKMLKQKHFLPHLCKLVDDINDIVEQNESKLSSVVLDLFNELTISLLVKGISVWLQLGNYSVFLVMEDLTREFTNLKPKKDVEVKEKVDKLLLETLVQMKRRYGECVEANLSLKVNRLLHIIRNEQKEEIKRILVFAAERRTVKYLQRVFADFTENLEPEEKIKLESKSVTGVSPSHQRDTMNEAEIYYENPTDFNKQTQDAQQMYNLYQQQQANRHHSNLNETLNKNLKSQQLKHDHSKLSKLRLDSDERYSTQIETIRGFRAQNFPVLFTTSVTQEGFDIPHCNLVISFDMPQKLKSFIQVKGRAREASSKYIIMCDERTFETMDLKKLQYESMIKLIQQITVEEMARRGDKSRIERPRYVREPGYKVVHIKGSGAIINTSNAMEILKSYVNSMKGYSEGNKMYMYYAGVPETGYICHIVLRGCAIQLVSGDFEKTKRMAARSAAFKAVKELRVLKQIKEDLRPKNELEMYEQRDLQKFNDLQIIKTDEIYHQIFKKYVRIETNQEKKLERQYYQCLGSSEFDFDRLNPAFKKHLPVFKVKSFPFQLYKITITNTNKSIKLPNLNTQVPNLHVGLLTCFCAEDVKEIFSGFRYEMKKNLGEFFSLELVEGEFELKEEEYKDLWRIHTFLLCTCLNQELRYFSHFLPDLALTIKSWRDKVSQPKYLYDLDKTRQFHPIFVMLQKVSNRKYTLSTELNKKIREHQSLLGKVYSFHNRPKDSKSKLPEQVSNSIHEQMIEFSKNYDELTFKNNFILQSITPDFLLNKCVVVAVERVGNDVEKLKGRMYEQGIYGKSKKMDYHTRQEQLKKYFKHSGSKHDCLVTFNMVRKRVKQITQDYMNKEEVLVKALEDPKQNRFLSEFTKHPLDLEVIFNILMAKQFVLPKVNDYTRAYFFRNNRLVDIQRQGRMKMYREKDKHYSYFTKRNLIDQNYQHLINYLQQHNSPRMKDLGTYLSKGHPSNYKWPCTYIDDYLEKHQLNNIQAIPKQPDGDFSKGQFICERVDINDILRCLTSRMYKSNKNQNYEQYEFIGDCVLKLLATIQTFTTKPEADEGELHLTRAHIISNSNLHYRSISKLLFQFIFTGTSDEPPAPFSFKKTENMEKDEYYKDTGIKIMNEAGASEGYFYIPGKTHADVVEALVGVYYIKLKRKLEECQFLLYSLDVLAYPTLKFDFTFEDITPKPFFAAIESRLQHKFKNKNILYQAFTHESFQSIITSTINRQLADYRTKIQQMPENSIQAFAESMKNKYSDKIFKSNIEKHLLYYERLEFLGDAVLDLVAVQYIYDNPPKVELDEGMYSLLKQASVSNRTLGLVALYWGLDEFVLIDSRESKESFEKIKSRFDFYFNNPDEIFTAQLAPLKVLGDVLQAYIGAVFLDSGFNYPYTRNICKRLMYPFIQHFTSPNMIERYPQFKMIKHLKVNNFEGIRIVKDCNKPAVNGKYEYVLMDKANMEINRCLEVSEKKAWDYLIEMYLSGVDQVAEGDKTEATNLLDGTTVVEDSVMM